MGQEDRGHGNSEATHREWVRHINSLSLCERPNEDVNSEEQQANKKDPTKIFRVKTITYSGTDRHAKKGGYQGNRR